MGQIKKVTKKGYISKSVDDISPIVLKGYNQQIDQINKQIFFGDLTVSAAIATATKTSSTFGQPVSLGDNFLYDPSKPQDRPLTNNTNKNVENIVTTAITSGWKYTFNNVIDIGATDTLRLTLSSLVLTGTFDVILESTTISDTITFSAQKFVGTASNYGTLTMEMAKGTVAGTINYAVFTKISIISSAVNTFRLYELETANNESNFIGAYFSKRIMSTNKFDMKMEAKLADITGGTANIDGVLKDFKGELKITVPFNDLELKAFITGAGIKLLPTFEDKLINSATGANSSVAISGQTLILPFSRNVTISDISLAIGSIDYSYTDNDKMLEDGYYCWSQDSVTKTITFKVGSTGNEQNGIIPDIKITSPVMAPIVSTVHQMGNYFTVGIEKKIAGGIREYKFAVKSLGTYSEKQDDYQKVEIEFMFYPVVKNGRLIYTDTMLIS